MQDNAFRLVKNVILAEDVMKGLAQYHHKEDCPKGQILPIGNCNCGADRNNERIEKTKRLLDIQYLISFEGE
jgi:hypothetical protein